MAPKKQAPKSNTSAPIALGNSDSLRRINELLPALTGLVESMNSNFGENSIMFLGQTNNATAGYVSWSTGLFALDDIIGNFGFVRGRFIQLWAEESAGKSTLALTIIANVQRLGGICAYIDGEHTLDADYARKIGVDVDALLISQPSSGAQALNIADTLAQSGLVDLIVVDSVPSLIPEELANKDHGQATVALLARLLGPASKIMVNTCNQTGSNVLWINQVREKVEISPMARRGNSGQKLYYPGGREYRHNLSYNIFMKYIGQETDSENQRIGHTTELIVQKNKTFPPFKKTTMQIWYDPVRNLWGFPQAADLYHTALKMGLINATGHKKIFAKQIELNEFGVGEHNSIQHIAANPDVAAEMRRVLLELKGYPEEFFFNRELAGKTTVPVQEIDMTRVSTKVAEETGIVINKQHSEQEEANKLMQQLMEMQKELQRTSKPAVETEKPDIKVTFDLEEDEQSTGSVFDDIGDWNSSSSGQDKDENISAISDNGSGEADGGDSTSGISNEESSTDEQLVEDSTV